MTLLYCVRTGAGIIFESELEQLRSRSKRFQYHVLLSQPHAEWSGRRGHVSREFVESTIKDLASPEFFLCGPPPFMEASRGILAAMGVKPERTEEHGVTIPSACRRGQCGTCKTKLLEWEVRMDAEEGPDPDSRARGLVLTCVGHADGAVKFDA